ncbi:MAG: hypothetical protein LBL43_08260 [Treponema sp.]|nr:hypothetical protein [Treponema sp.]
MIKTSGTASDFAGPPAASAGKSLNASKLELLRMKINDEGYVREAIQRIAWTLSNELLDIPHGGNSH